MPNFNSEDSDNSRNAPYRSSRRAARKGRVQRERRLTVRSELRDEPDVRKIARAIISLAMAEAEREALARAEADALRGGADHQSPQEPAGE